MSARITEPLMQVLSDMRTSIERDDTNAVNHFRSNRHISRPLENLKIVVIDNWKVRRLIVADDATYRQCKVHVTLRKAGVDASCGRHSICFCLCALGWQRDQRRNMPIGR